MDFEQMQKTIKAIEKQVQDLTLEVRDIKTFREDYQKQYIERREVVFKGKVYDADGTVVINS